MNLLCTNKSRIRVSLQGVEPRYQNGPGFEYQIQMKRDPDRAWCNQEKATEPHSHTLCVDRHRDTLLRVVAQNDEGRADLSGLQVLTVPADQTGKAP